jgi:hypothetical protein
MNSKQRRTLAAVFSNPMPKTLPWNDLEALLRAVGSEVVEGDGSRVAFRLKGARVSFRRPHPGNEAQAYQIRAAREFLTTLGITRELTP